MALNDVVVAWDESEQVPVFPVTDYYRYADSSRRFAACLARLKALHAYKWQHDRAFAYGVEATVEQWLDNFLLAAEKPLAFMMLDGLLFYSKQELSLLLDEALTDFADREFGVASAEAAVAEMKTRAVFAPLTDSGCAWCRLLRQNYGLGEAVRLSLADVSFEELVTVEHVVLVDDFVGSGTQAVRRLRAKAAELRALNPGVRISFLILVACGWGRDAIAAELSASVYCGEVLSARHQVFAADSVVVPNAVEREMLRDVCLRYGKMLAPRHPLGWDDSQLCVVMFDNTPNNTLPVVWASRARTWRPLFPRKTRI